MSETVDGQDIHDAGMKVRRTVLGADYVDKAGAHADDLTVEFQRFLTTYCWGEIWTDERLSRQQHSLVVLAIAAALGRVNEFEAHAKGALRNGVTPDQLTAVLRQIAVYAGVPAAVSSQAALRRAIDEHCRGE
ncbi:carboxymuconolactone decarboxylase family protein [Sciscionella marina]|uniref:carboxymuconolactone decarboxylase family protein n=1 Tax=Sciscionella marina TaxID=508770 RepID=UPI000360FDF8|nr:carboxymuconolactone decarboxylase family protein [Sciscionella marina]